MEYNTTWHYKEFDQLSAKELYSILRARNDVFVVEQRILEQDCDNKDIQASHLWADLDGEVVAYIRVLKPGQSYPNHSSFGRVLTKKSCRGLKLGRRLIENAIEVISNKFPDNNIKISAQAYLSEFYKDFGFEVMSDEYIEGGIPHIKMVKKII